MMLEASYIYIFIYIYIYIYIYKCRGVYLYIQVIYNIIYKHMYLEHIFIYAEEYTCVNIYASYMYITLYL